MSNAALCPDCLGLCAIPVFTPWERHLGAQGIPVDPRSHQLCPQGCEPCERCGTGHPPGAPHLFGCAGCGDLIEGSVIHVTDDEHYHPECSLESPVARQVIRVAPLLASAVARMATMRAPRVSVGDVVKASRQVIYAERTNALYGSVS